MTVKLSADKMLMLLLAFLPMIFLPFTLFIEGGKAKVFYDGLYVVGVATLLFCMPWNGSRFTKQALALFFISGLFFSWFALKLFLVKAVVATDGNFYWVPYLREIKPGLYLLFGALFISRWGSPSIEAFIRAGNFFSYLVLISFFIGILRGGSRPEVIDEANYDNFLVLIACIASFAKFGLKFDGRFLLYLLATLASQSKTGVVCFFVIIAIFSIKEFGVKVIIQLAAGLVVIAVVMAVRMSQIENIEDIDRFRMWLSYFELVKNSSLMSLLFGFFPGVPMRYDDPYIGWFITFQSEETLGILGLHPFNYHAMWLRLMCSWGVIPLTIFALWLIKKFKITRISLAVLSLIVIQGASMGVFYLSTVAVPLILFIVAANRYRPPQKTKLRRENE